MKVTVRYFASAREAVGRADEALALPEGADVARLAEALVARHAALAGLRLRYAVGDRFADPAHALREGDVVALIPPVSGG